MSRGIIGLAHQMQSEAEWTAGRNFHAWVQPRFKTNKSTAYWLVVNRKM